MVEQGKHLRHTKTTLGTLGRPRRSLSKRRRSPAETGTGKRKRSPTNVEKMVTGREEPLETATGTSRETGRRNDTKTDTTTTGNGTGADHLTGRSLRGTRREDLLGLVHN